MKNGKESYQQVIVGNILKIMKSKDLKQAAIAAEAFLEPTALSKIINGTRRLSVDEFAKIATALGMTPLELMTWPERYIPAEKKDEPAEVFLQLRLTKEKKDQVMRLVFGDNNIEILNK